jgi:secondary thiamine-phosphate synthase enzyme
MSSLRTELTVPTRGFCHVVDITGPATDFAAGSGQGSGLLNLFVPGSTAGLTTIEYESGAVEDLCQAIERMAPEGIGYAHDARWGDGNGFSHVRAALLGPSLTIPVENGRLLLGTWQQVVLVDFDNGPRDRRILLTLS